MSRHVIMRYRERIAEEKILNCGKGLFIEQI